jgi:L-amino acid N-acyltransferase YncA
MAAVSQSSRGGIRQLTAVTGAQNAPSRRLVERRGFQFTGSLPAGEVGYTLSLG